MSQTDNDFLFGRPLKEEDEPLDKAQFNQIDPLLVRQLEIGERDKTRKDKRYFSAFKLIVGCLVILGIIFVIDVITSATLKHQPSSITKDIIEIIKTLLFTLSGYLFAKKRIGKLRRLIKGRPFYIHDILCLTT